MPKPRVEAEFETALIDTFAKLKVDTDEPSLAPMRILAMLMRFAASPDRETAEFGQTWMRELHLTYEWARSHDDNWTNQRRPKRVVRLRPEHHRPGSALPFALVKFLWPVLPLASFLYYTRASKGWTHEKTMARVHEYFFIFLCTKPRVMHWWLYHLAKHVLASHGRRFPGLDVDQLADEVVESLARRPLPVARYRAKAKTITDAASAVRRYMTRAIRRRANDRIRTNLDPSFEVPASTVRRWKNRNLAARTPDEAHAIREKMKENRRHWPLGRASIAYAAREIFHRPRSSVAVALRAAEKAHYFVAERGPDRTVWLTTQQIELLRKHLPSPRSRSGARPPKTRGGST